MAQQDTPNTTYAAKTTGIASSICIATRDRMLMNTHWPKINRRVLQQNAASVVFVDADILLVLILALFVFCVTINHLCGLLVAI